jgi:hypothetical protein
MSLWESGAECYSLDMICPLQAHLVPRWYAILGDSGNLGNEDYVGSKSLEYTLKVILGP